MRTVALLLLAAHAVTAYELGEDTTLCWVTVTSAQSSTDSCAGYSGPRQIDCNGSSIEMSFATPVETDGLRVTTPLESLVPHMIDCTVRVADPSQVANLSIAHFNLHSCNDNVGLCTPFIKDTPGLSTHSAVKTGTLSADGVGQFVSDVSLDEGVYTVIAHARWFDAHGLQHDMARARKIVVEDVAVVPPPRPSQPVHTSDSRTTMYAAVFSLCFVAAVCVAVWRRVVWLRKRKVSLHLVRTGKLPDLTLPAGRRFHLFLSHTWASGQDQAAVIKQRLLAMLPQLSIFLDVDDLIDISRLEEHVAESALVLVFLSKGYFLSANCCRELKAATEQGVTMLPVHEANSGRGGAPLSQLISECPDYARPVLFPAGAGPLIPWLRARPLQITTLTLIAEAVYGELLRQRDEASPDDEPGWLGRGPTSSSGVERKSSRAAVAPITEAEEDPKTPREAHAAVEGRTELTMRGNPIYEKHVFPPNSRLYASRHNPGAADVAELIQQCTYNLTVTNVPPKPTQVQGRQGRSVRDMAADGVRKARMHKAHGGETLSVAMQAELGGLAQGSMMLLYLNKDSFMGDAGSHLAAELRLARSNGNAIVLVHEQRDTHGWCDFDRFFYVTPADLAQGGLFKDIAMPLMARYRHLAVAISLIASKMGAVREQPRKARVEGMRRRIRMTERGGDSQVENTTPLSAVRRHGRAREQEAAEAVASSTPAAAESAEAPAPGEREAASRLIRLPPLATATPEAAAAAQQ